MIRSLYPGELPLQAEQPLLVARLQQFIDQQQCERGADRQPLLTGRDKEPQTDVRLAGAAVADCDDILFGGSHTPSERVPAPWSC